MKQIKAVLVGAGNRGCVYSDYSLLKPEELKIVAVVDPRELARKSALERYSIPSDMAFASLDEFLSKKINADIVINATMDEMHYETALKIIGAGYDMLIEKPVTPNKKELLEIRNLAKEKGVQVFVCHVLRYTPFYKTIKEIINAGKIGTIMTMELNEHVWIAHFMDSFVRGKWNSEAKCGSGFLLQKSCHDTDLMCWLNNSTKPVRVMSIGSRSLFTEAMRPNGATDFCYNCPHNDTCLYSAQKIHLEQDLLPFQTWLEMNKPIDDITKEEKEEFLKWHDYGRCAYKSGGDICDRQVLTVEFENGSVCSFTMVGGTSKAGRNLHIVGTHGEIEGSTEEGKFILRTFDRSGDRFWYDEEVIDINDKIKNSSNYSGHAGGDYAIMNELCAYLNGDKSSISITSIDDSVNGHLLVYAAEESRKTKTSVDVK